MFYLNTCVHSIHEGQKWVSDLLELGLQRIMNNVWMLEPKPWSSARAANDPDLRAIYSNFIFLVLGNEKF